MMPRMSSSRMIRYDSSSILISVPPYFEISTLSPFFTVKSTFFPLSSILPVPKATTFPSCGFSLAVSGIMIPPFFTSCSSSGCTSTRSPRGLTLTAAIGFRLLLGWFGLGRQPRKLRGRRQIVDQRNVPDIALTFSCSRPPLQTPHRQRRRHRVYLRPLLRRRLAALRVRVAAPDVDRTALTLVCTGQR